MEFWLITRWYGGVLCLLYGTVTAAGLLSFGGVYAPVPALALTLVLTLVAGVLYFRHDNGWLKAAFMPAHTSERGLLRVMAGAALTLLVGVFLLRLAAYPLSSAGNYVPGDATGYHFLKAMELIRTGTLWNITHLYGEYPIGYESLVAAGLLLTGDWYPAGIIQGGVVLLLALTLTLLLRRYTPLPDSLALLLSVLVLFYPDVYSQLLIVGKNDILLTTLLLGAVLHSPATVRGAAPVAHPLGLALLTSVAMASKPGGVWILAFLWLLVLVHWGLGWRAGQQYMRWQHFAAALMLMFPGGLWVIRNYVMMGRFFSPEVSSFFEGSIFANLTYMRLYTSGLESVVLLVLGAWVLLLIVVLAPRVRPSVTLLLLVMVGAFIVTPLGAFHTPARTTVHVEWRYTTHLFFYLWCLMIAWVVPWAYPLLTQTRRRRQMLALSSAGVCVAAFAILNPADLLVLRPDNIRQLRDPYPAPVGVGGYYSVYDYVQREVRDSVIFTHGAEPFYLYNPARPSNQIIGHTRHPLGMPDLIPLPDPHYLVYIPGNVPGEARDPFIFVQDDAWEIVYEDTAGAVYRRAAP